MLLNGGRAVSDLNLPSANRSPSLAHHSTTCSPTPSASLSSPFAPILLPSLARFLLSTLTWQGPFIILSLHLSSSATIDSPTNPHPARDSHPSTASPSPLESITSNSLRPSQQSLTSRTSLPPSLVPATRSRSELEQGSSSSSSVGSLSSFYTDAEHTRARKRQRIDSTSSPTSTHRPSIDQEGASRNIMRLSESDHDSILSSSPDVSAQAGPSSVSSFDIPTNGITNGNGHAPMTNGNTPAIMGNGIQKHDKSIARVNLPGTTLYEDSFVDREEFVRLVIQSLRDVGYAESAATLEAESGYIMEVPEVAQFRQYIFDGSWAKAEAALMRLGVADEDGLMDAKFLISQQKYLELLEAKKTTAALHVLRNELAPLKVDPDQLHTLSSLIMCSEPEDLRRRAGWDGASGASRRQLLDSLHHYIPSSLMIPQRRFSTLLHQARAYQRYRCVYHNSPSDATAFSLYSDHQCNKSDFPRITTIILQVHTDEVWNMEWSHDGLYLASASKDKSAIIWRTGSAALEAGSHQDWTPYFVLRDHPYPVGCLAWSKDDSVLLTSAEHHIKLWNTKTGVCIRSLDEHTETVTALSWLPDGSGFISGGLDRKIIHWEADGKQRDAWGATAIRITDLAVTPDFTRLVTVGMEHLPSLPSVIDTTSSRGVPASDAPSTSGGNPPLSIGSKGANRMIVFDLTTKQTELSIRLEGELTSVKVSQNSQYALINHAPDEIHLWDLNAGRVARKYTGQRQGRHVIRSCFGGIDGNFVVSGSEDGNVYVWHRDTGALLEVLSGHGEGSVNSVAWNPRNERMFASCSDDNTIRIWEAPLAEMSVDSVLHHPSRSPSFPGKGKGKTQQRWDGDDVDFVAGSNATRI